jgi:hypothetical protein
MKLAEALAQRSECQTRLDELKKRIVRNARVQEGEQPAEDPQVLLDEVDRLALRLVELVQTINRTNSQTPFDDGTTVADAIAERDVLGRKRDLLMAVGEAASTRHDRSSKSEVRIVATVPVGKIHRHVDQLSKRYREIDTKIQELNWKTEVV